MRRCLLVLLLLFSALASAGTAGAVVVTQGATGVSGVALVPSDHRWSGLDVSSSPGPCQDPWLSSDLGGPVLPDSGLCYHGGSVVHRNETFDLAWDPKRRDWESTRNYVQQYLRNVADSSGSLGTPYAVATQYRDIGGRAENQSVYGGGCIDFGHTGGASCQFGSTTASTAGTDYPASGCPVAGTNQFGQTPNSVLVQTPNDVCLTDAQIQSEVSRMVSQAGFVSRTQNGYAPLVTVTTPPGVVDCLDAGGNVCSSNVATVPPTPKVHESDTGGSVVAGVYEVEITETLGTGETVASASASVTANTSTATISVDPPQQIAGATSWSLYVTVPGEETTYYRQKAGLSFGGQYTELATPTAAGPLPPENRAFCSYHSYLTVGGVRVPYVVQPWTALTGCDEPDAPQITYDPPMAPDALAAAVGSRLVSPLSQAELAAITDPYLDGWSGLDGSEINDNGYPIGCVPLGNQLDSTTVAGATYFLQREFNNGGVLEVDPNALGCEGTDGLKAQFVAPSSANPGDALQFDGSKTISTLVIPSAGYAWNFGDGTTASGPSIVHTFAQNGTYTVTLTVTDRGGYSSAVSQTVQIGPPQVAKVVAPPPGGSTGGGKPQTQIKVTPKPKPKPKLTARLQLLPQSLRSVLKSGMAVRITSNLKADGITTLMLPKSYAKQAHLHVTRASTVVIGRGTVSGVKVGTITLHVKIPRTTIRRLQKLRRLALTISVALHGSSSTRQTLNAAGRY